MAAHRQYTAATGERVQETTWFHVSAWGKLAETCHQYLQRGSKVLVEGRLTADPATGSPRLWTRQDGTTAASFEISTASVQFLSSRRKDEAAPEAEAPF